MVFYNPTLKRGVNGRHYRKGFSLDVIELVN
jgi:hypothetical protein